MEARNSGETKTGFPSRRIASSGGEREKMDSSRCSVRELKSSAAAMKATANSITDAMTRERRPGIFTS
jgi:hypothetical protein